MERTSEPVVKACPLGLASEPASVESSVVRSTADRRARRFLRLPVDGPPTSIFAANNAFSQSIAISATRCLVTYIAIPFVLPLLNLSGRVGPFVSILLSLASIIAITVATRRFFGADHKWRWWYAGFGSAVLVWLVIQSVIDLTHIVG